MTGAMQRRKLIFQSTPSARRETADCFFPQWLQYSISIHSLRKEGDCPACKAQADRQNFNPLPPQGGRHKVFVVFHGDLDISIHSLRKEGDCKHG